MRIAWFTPLRQKSAIGRFSVLVAEEIAKQAAIDLWIADPAIEQLHETHVRTIRYHGVPGAADMLEEYDFLVYNMGDQAANHGPIFEMSKQAPGIVILHDYVMHHFFAMYFDQRGRWDEYRRVMQRWHGVDLLETRGEPGWRVWETDEAFDFPLFQEAALRARGIVAHSQFVRDAVARSLAAPVTHIPLAYEVNRSVPSIERDALKIPPGKKLAVTIGQANENKRIHVVMATLAANPDLAKSLLYVVVGGCEGPYGEKLLALQDRLGLREHMRFTGYASDSLLQSYLAHADFCINLRLPAMEGGSASCAEQMLYGKAIIVTDTGVYRDLPDDCVWKTRPESESADLQCAMRTMAGNSELRHRLGEAARGHAEKNFSPAAYADSVLAFCNLVAHTRPAMDLIDEAAQELRRMGVSSDMEVVATVARESALLMDGDYDPPVLREKEV
jgi:glycosyltransferase involved in cell wall biosynthesis